MAFWKKQNYRDRNRSVADQGWEWGEIKDKGAQETFRGDGKIIVCDCYRIVFIENFPRIVYLHLLNLTV